MKRSGMRERRRRLLARVHGRVLEVGAGTGHNLEHYPEGIALVATDISPRTLDRARLRALLFVPQAEVLQADVQSLPFREASFDTVVATCLFCSVSDPVRGLRELARVVKPEGQVLLLEHVRPENLVLGLLADVASPFSRRLLGPSLNRRTEANVRSAGLEFVEVRREGIWREIVARRAAR